MEYLLNPSLLVPTIGITILTFSLIIRYRNLISRPIKRQQAPPPPEVSGALPIIGHLHLLAGSQPLHAKMGKMADKYGPIFTLRTGVHSDLIVSNWEIAKECLTTHDKNFANRPKSLAAKILTLDGAFFGFSRYGAYWRQARKIATTELLSKQRMEGLREVRESEVRRAIKEVYGGNKGEEVEMRKWFGDIILNLMCRVVVGKRFEEATSGGSGERKALKELLLFLGTFFVSDVIPWLRWLDLGHERAMKRMTGDVLRLAERWLEEHRKADHNHHDFMDVMVSTVDANDFGDSRFDADTIIKFTSVGMIVAAKDTTTMAMTWALALLLNNPHSLQKVQQEVDRHVGRDRQVNESDLPNLVYLNAVVKETLRLYPSLPFSMPHQSAKDCTVAGHHVPAGTRLLINLSKLHRDPTVWARPNEFVPERFLRGGEQENMDVRGQSFELLPFGSGRRICPGVSLALQMTQLSLAALLHGFEVSTPSNESVDMTESVVFQSCKTTPFPVILTPRLQSQAYN